MGPPFCVNKSVQTSCYPGIWPSVVILIHKYELKFCSICHQLVVLLSIQVWDKQIHHLFGYLIIFLGPILILIFLQMVKNLPVLKLS